MTTAPPIDSPTAPRRVPPELAAVRADFAAALVKLQAKHQNEVADLHDEFQTQMAAVLDMLKKDEAAK